MAQDNLDFQTGRDFTLVYYGCMDDKRHLMSRHYMDNAALVWNGIGKNGSDEVQKFLASLPLSQHSLTSHEVLRIPDEVVGNKVAYLIQVGGSVKYRGTRNRKMFHQTFTITNEGDKWKIVSDCFRFQESVPA